MKKLDEQTTRAVTTMCQMGLGIDGLESSFPGYTREELEAVLEKVNREKSEIKEDHSPISDAIISGCSS